MDTKEHVEQRACLGVPVFVRRATSLLAICMPLVVLAGCRNDSTPASSDGGGQAPTTATNICPLLTAAVVTTTVGYKVTFKSGPFNACEYNPEAPKLANISIATSLPVKGNGGFAGTKAGALALIPGTPKDLTGIGTEAFVVTNKKGDQFALGFAAAMVKGQLLTVNLTGGELAQLGALAEKLLRLAASKI